MVSRLQMIAPLPKSLPSSFSLDYRSLHNLIDKQKDFPPPADSSNKCGAEPHLTISNINKWMWSLSKTLTVFAYHGCAHRYVRAEYVMVSKGGNIKLTHHDMAI